MYDKFKNRFIRKMKFKNFILKHIVICVTSFIVLISGLGALLYNIGRITSYTNENVNVIYGDESSYNTNVFLGSPQYLHKTSDSEEWIKGLPVNPGEYEVKSYSRRIFGNKQYTEPVSYNVNKRDTLIQIKEDHLNYGEKIDLKHNLAKGDYIQNLDFNYILVDENTVTMQPIKDSIIIYNQDKKDVTDNYNIETQDQTIAFKKNHLSIETVSHEACYSATTFDNENYQITDGKLGYKDRIEINFKEKGITNVYEGKNEAEIKIFNVHDKDVTKFYDLDMVFGDINIYRKALFINSGSSIKPEDGTTLTNNIHNSEGLLNKHYTIISNTSILEEPGTIENDFDVTVYNEFDEDVTDNYRIYKECGNLTITPNLIITSNSNSKEYDGSFLTDEGYTLNKDLPKNHKIKVISSTNITDYGTTKNILDYEIYNEFDEDVTLYYNITKEYGDLSITKRKAVLTSNEDKKTYDGFGLSKVTFETERILEGHIIELDTINNLGADVGFYENSFTYHIYDENHNNMDDNYDIKEVWNDKEIIKRKVKFESAEASDIYKDKPLKSETINISGEGLITGHKYKITEEFKSYVDVGKYKNTFKVKIVDKDGQDINHNYEVNYVYNNFEIKKRPIGILTESFEKFYDHEPVCKPNYTLRPTTLNDGLIEGHTFIPGSFKTFVEPKDHINSIDFTIKKGDKDVTEFYEGVDFGHILIKRPIVKVTTGSGKKEYDGTPLTNPNFTIDNVDNFDVNISVDVIGTITYVGIIDNEAIIKITDKNGKDITDDFNVIPDFGTLEIIKLNNGQLNDGTGSINTSGQIATKPQNKDSINEKQAFMYTTDCVDKIYFRAYSFGDYELNKWKQPTPYQTKTISPLYFASETIGNKYESKEIIINLDDKLDFLLPYYSIDGPDYNDDFNNNLVDNPQFYEMMFSPYVYDYQDKMTVPNYLMNEELNYYNFVKENYLSLPVNTKNVMLKVANANGLNPNNPNIIFEVQNFMRKSASLNDNFKPIDSDVDMAVQFLMKTREGNSQHFATAATCLYRALGIPARYTIGFVHQPTPNIENIVTWGDLKAWVEVYIPQMGWINIDVTNKVVDTEDGIILPEIEEKQTIIIRPITVNKEYDGTPLYPKNEVDLDYCKDFKKLLDQGYTYEMTVSGSHIDKGPSGKSTITHFDCFDPLGNSVLDKYDFVLLNGELEVTKPQVLIVIDSISKYYDGTPIEITKNNVKVKTPEGYRCEFDVNGYLDKIGESTATINNLKIYDSLNNDVTDSNEIWIRILGGKLTIKKRPIEITIASDIKQYDGTPLQNNYFWISQGSLKEGHQINIEINSSITEIGKIENRPSSIKIIDENGNNVKFAYDIHVIQGYLEVV